MRIAVKVCFSAEPGKKELSSSVYTEMLFSADLGTNGDLRGMGLNT